MTNPTSPPRQRITLPAVDHTLAAPLMYALEHRSSCRSFAPGPLTEQHLSGVLWAAAGINRHDGKATAPVIWPLKVFVATEEGLYLYDPVEHHLDITLAEDIRGMTGKHKFTQKAPVSLIYVMDYEAMTTAWIDTMGGKDFFAGTTVGYVSQNVYLYAAATDLATVVLTWLDKEKLARKMALKPSERILLTQSLGYREK